MILEFKRWADQNSAGGDMSAHTTLEKNFSTSMSTLAANISGTTQASVSITDTEKNALVTLIQSPQF